MRGVGGGGAGYHHRANQTEELRTLRGFHSPHSKYTRCARPGTPERRQSSSLEREGPAPRRAAQGGVGVWGGSFCWPSLFHSLCEESHSSGVKVQRIPDPGVFGNATSHQPSGAFGGGFV